MRRLFLAARCVLTAAVVSAATATAAHAQDIYDQALAKYAEGDAASATAILDQLSNDDVTAAVNKRWRRPVFSTPGSSRQFRIAILAHTETWFRRVDAGTVRAVDPHFEAARSMVRSLIRASESDSPGVGMAERTFGRDWYLLTASFLQGLMQVGLSRFVLAEARKFFPRDSETLFVIGSGHELVSGLTAAVIQHVDSSGKPGSDERVNEDKELRQAFQAFTEAVALEPKFVEARLRLGRVSYRLGDLNGATKELETVRSLSKTPEVKYLATVFLALVATTSGDLARGAELYREAIRIVPDGQIAYVGLSEVDYLTGRTAEASQTMAALLARTLKDDPWWAYQMGDWWHFEGRLTALRAGVRE